MPIPPVIKHTYGFTQNSLKISKELEFHLNPKNINKEKVKKIKSTEFIYEHRKYAFTKPNHQT